MKNILFLLLLGVIFTSCHTTDDAKQAFTIERMDDCYVLRDMKSARADTLRADNPNFLSTDMKKLKISPDCLSEIASLKIGHQLRLIELEKDDSGGYLRLDNTITWNPLGFVIFYAIGFPIFFILIGMFIQRRKQKKKE